MRERMGKGGFAMLRSMTGYGHYEADDQSHKITIEIKSVNHRYNDINIRIPRQLSSFETAIRNEIKEQISRGKVDVTISYEDYEDSLHHLKFHDQLAKEYMQCFKQISEEFELPFDIKTSFLAKCQDVLTIEEQGTASEDLWTFIEAALKHALEEFVASRTREGEHLRNDLLKKLEQMEELIDFIEEQAPISVQGYQERLEEKVRELLKDQPLDDARILTEVTLYADKVCVDEETVRLRSHIKTTRQALLEGGNVGRKLDFIAQEMNREANTILSKSNDLEISNKAIDLKAEIEKVREQIQNIE